MAQLLDNWMKRQCFIFARVELVKVAARMLLMYAFAAEIISDISIKNLRSQIDDMIKKRLRGELNICEQCVLQCSHPEHSYDFKIDISKI